MRFQGLDEYINNGGIESNRESHSATGICSEYGNFSHFSLAYPERTKYGYHANLIIVHDSERVYHSFQRGP